MNGATWPTTVLDVPGIVLRYSKSEVNRAGQRLRSIFTPPVVLPDDVSRQELEQIVQAFDIAYHFRACHEYPLRKVTIGLRSMVSRESDRVIVAQRFKRFPSMINKLVRYPDMSLSRMQDIGGCRAIVANGAEVQGVLRRIRKNWRPPENRIRDYVKKPAPSGYRAVHVIVERDERLIEVQLRTPIQHEWATAVERMGSRYSFDLKSGEGPPALLKFFQVASEGMSLEERGEPPDGHFLGRYDEARQNAAEWLGG